MVLFCEVDKTVFALGRKALKRKVLKLYHILNKAFLFLFCIFWGASFWSNCQTGPVFLQQPFCWKDFEQFWNGRNFPSRVWWAGCPFLFSFALVPGVMALWMAWINIFWVSNSWLTRPNGQNRFGNKGGTNKFLENARALLLTTMWSLMSRYPGAKKPLLGKQNLSLALVLANENMTMWRSASIWLDSSRQMMLSDMGRYASSGTLCFVI